jgi:hypothetical protein
MATKQEQKKYEMSLDDVRSYLLDTGAIKEAEKMLNVATEPTNEESAAKATESFVKPADVYDRISRRREIVSD